MALMGSRDQDSSRNYIVEGFFFQLSFYYRDHNAHFSFIQTHQRYPTDSKLLVHYEKQKLNRIYEELLVNVQTHQQLRIDSESLDPHRF